MSSTPQCNKPGILETLFASSSLFGSPDSVLGSLSETPLIVHQALFSVTGFM